MLAIGAFLAMVACDPTVTIEVSAITSDGVPVLSWNEGLVHEVTVRSCDDDVCERECTGDGYLSFGGTDVWQVGLDDDQLGSLATAEPTIESPITYGQEDVPGNERDYPARTLEPGVIYGVEVNRYEPCDPPSADCAQTEAVGCSTFEVEETLEFLDTEVP